MYCTYITSEILVHWNGPTFVITKIFLSQWQRTIHFGRTALHL